MSYIYILIILVGFKNADVGGGAGINSHIYKFKTIENCMAVREAFLSMNYARGRKVRGRIALYENAQCVRITDEGRIK